MKGYYLIGVHARGTDAVSTKEIRPHRQGSLVLSRYLPEIQRLLESHPDYSRVFVATDDETSLQYFIDELGERVLWYSNIRHEGGEAAGKGPTGWIMPAYIAQDRDRAAENGEEAVIDYLLLSRCNYLIHNASSLARTALLARPDLRHSNTHHRKPAPAPVSPDLIEIVKRAKVERRSTLRQYRERPELAFIVHSFNRASNVSQLVTGLRSMGDHELIVCDDGSLDGSHDQWIAHLDRPNDFLIHSNDIHEIRILDRAIRFTQAEVICLVQDDDTIPHQRDWLDDALVKMEAYPQLAIIGGFMGFGGFDPNDASPLWGPAPFRFVHHVNIGPYFIRKAHYEALGGWDYTLSRVGEPGICFDNELCLRAWVHGYQVGYSFVPFKGPPGQYRLDGGTVLFSGATRMRNKIENEKRILATYASEGLRIDELVQDANQKAGLL